MWQVGFGKSSEVLCLHVNMASQHFEICLETVRRLGRSEGTGDQTHKKRGNQGPIQRVCMGAGGRG